MKSSIVWALFCIWLRRSVNDNLTLAVGATGTAVVTTDVVGGATGIVVIAVVVFAADVSWISLTFISLCSSSAVPSHGEFS